MNQKIKTLIAVGLLLTSATTQVASSETTRSDDVPNLLSPDPYPAPRTSAASQAHATSKKVVMVSLVSEDEGSSKFSITSLVENLSVSSVVANRGNCEITFIYKIGVDVVHLPIQLKYGEQLGVMMTCNPIELVVYTDLGYQKFTNQ